MNNVLRNILLFVFIIFPQRIIGVWIFSRIFSASFDHELSIKWLLFRALTSTTLMFIAFYKTTDEHTQKSFSINRVHAIVLSGLFFDLGAFLISMYF
jgi:NADH:ubiquinone oxidoreductase subunit 4 (subunit M)